MDRIDSVSPFWFLLGWWPATGLLVWASFFLYQLRFPPGCFGIGWGCHLEPHYYAVGALVVAFPMLLLFAISIGVWQWMLRRSGRSSPLPSRIALGAPGAILVLVGLGVWVS